MKKINWEYVLWYLLGLAIAWFVLFVIFDLPLTKFNLVIFLLSCLIASVFEDKIMKKLKDLIRGME